MDNMEKDIYRIIDIFQVSTFAVFPKENSIEIVDVNSHMLNLKFKTATDAINSYIGMIYCNEYGEFKCMTMTEIIEKMKSSDKFEEIVKTFKLEKLIEGME